MALKTLLIGASGRLGREVMKYFPGAYAPSHSDLDVRDYESVAEAFERENPNLVIHLGGIADVRISEEKKELAWQTNVVGTENLVKACSRTDKHPLLLYPSTPCVFRCDEGGYTESSNTNPINFYGETKAAAEKIVLSYDNALVFRKNFVPREKWRYQKAFVDRFGTYLFADEVAFLVAQLPTSGYRGIVHITGRERLTMYEVARITSNQVGQMTLREADLELCPDMSLRSERIPAFPITKSPVKPTDYRAYSLPRAS